MSEKIAQPIQYILKSEIGGVLSKGFAQLYRTKPNFPVTYLAQWLKEYSKNNYNKKLKIQTVNKNLHQLHKIQESEKKVAASVEHKKHKQQQQHQLSEKQFHDTVSFSQHLEDLLQKWLPNYIENKYHLSGAYVGYLTHQHRPVAANNFQPGAEFDTQSPKIIQYIGASDSQKSTIHMKILPNQKGISFDCFNQPQPQPEQAEPAEGQQPKPPKQPKKTYIFVPDVTKNEKIHYFKFPKLGSYCCFPLKLKSYLIQSLFDQAVTQYRQFIKQKQQAEKQYNEKYNEVKNQYQQAKKKYEQFQVSEEDPSPQQLADKKNLQDQAKRLHEALQEFQKNPPKASQPKFTHTQKCYLLGCDTLGQDRQIPQVVLDEIDRKMLYFKKQFETKQKAMLLHDILGFIEQESKLDAIEHTYRQQEKNATAQSEQQAKQKNIKDKQLQFQIASSKAKKMDAVFQDPNIQKSMKTYFSYNTPKFKQIIQIALMFLGYKLSDINLPRKNALNFRKIKQAKFTEQFMSKLYEFNLKPVEAQPCAQQYKINKLLQRLQKIDLQQIGRYNGYLWVLANQIKAYCWALILCRDAKKQAYEISVKQKQDRAAEIEKYKQEKQKAMDTAKAELGQQNQANFNQQQWSANYIIQNPQPQPLEVIKLQQYHNID